MSYKVFGILILLLHFYKAEKCAKSDLELQYTACDKTGHRWLVSVPKFNKTCDATSDFNMPKNARNCGDPCEPGTYLEIESQECKHCPSGTYSQGDTIEIDSWQKLPTGFQSLSIDLHEGKCKREEWTPNGDYIMASVSQCESILSFSVQLYKPGELKFDYQMPEEGTLFVVKIRNDECSATFKGKSNTNAVNFMDSTSSSSMWKRKTVSLKKGSNVITWIAVGIESGRSAVKISKVIVTNTIFSSQCTNCSAGYFSSTKSSICSPCSINTYNDRVGSDQCKPCSAEQYALPGSRSCKQKSSCTASDYSYRWTECNKQKQRKKIYSWIEPKLCSESSPNAARLPIDSNAIPCESCPRGTFLNYTLQSCQFCPHGTMASGAGDNCTACSPNTKPISTIWYDKWSHSLPNLTFFCVKGFGKCKDEDSWIMNGDHLQSSMLSDVHFMQLEFQTDDDETLSSVTSRSSFSFQFSMNCIGYCALHLILKRNKYASVQVNKWVNTTIRTESHHNIPSNTLGKYIWFFSHASASNMAQKSEDYLKIYSIKVSNLKNVGAIECRYCDPKSWNNGCLDCDKGKYFSKDSHQCEQCPKGQILRNYPGQSVADCVSCKNGLRSLDGTKCVPSITFASTWHSFYDFSKLKGHHLLHGNRLFNTHGQEYIHVFNLTLFDDKQWAMSFCHNNLTLNDSAVEVSSPMCRITIIVDKSENNTLYSIQSLSLVERFSKIQQSNFSASYWSQMNESLIKNGFEGDSTGVDVHVHLASDRKTDICTKGRQTIITLRCDKKSMNTKFLLPPKCPVETCDGCNFHFLLTSKEACPYCRPEDFTVITEECVNGHQKRHFQEPSYCILQPGSESTENIKCPLVTMRTVIIVMPTLFVVLFLMGLVVYCYKKNKSLEYKYMRLISGNEDNEHILAGAESCGMNDDDEDEDDDVKIKTNSKSGKMFARFNKPNRNRKDENDMETVNLNDNPEFDI